VLATESRGLRVLVDLGGPRDVTSAADDARKSRDDELGRRRSLSGSMMRASRLTRAVDDDVVARRRDAGDTAAVSSS